jgi:5-methylcytosine-specific restriction endonuclease McrA
MILLRIQKKIKQLWVNVCLRYSRTKQSQTNYRRYLSSPSWRFNPVRLRELEAAGLQCRLCPNSTETGHVIECHHRTYVRLGREIDGDLIALCRECHNGVTSMLRARRYASSPVEITDYVPANVDASPLFDPLATGDSK